jgi:hypothetical protein
MPGTLQFEQAINLVEKRRFRLIREFESPAQCLAVIGELSGDRCRDPSHIDCTEWGLYTIFPILEDHP